MREDISKVLENVGKVIIGKEEVLEKLLAGLLAGGHVLLEDVPGTGKTKMAKALSASLGVDFGRIQFTPDMLPADITGMHIYSRETESFVWKEALFLPIYCWRIKSTVRRPGRRLAFWNVWRNGRLR